MQTINDNFYCPINYTMMMDPVIGPDGHTYERSAIEKWLTNSNRSPITKQIMNSKDLIPNIALRDTIQAFLALNPNVDSVKAIKLRGNLERNIMINTKLIDNFNLFIRLIANDESLRKPSVFFFVIDVSGSMNTPASTNNNSESDGFSRLDLVKHSVRTVIEVLNENDSICLITFSDDSKVVLDVTKMNDFGKEKAIEVLKNIHTEGMTNIWDGLRVALLNVEKITDPNVNISIMLLTDGEPNQNPPRGIVPTLISALESKKINQSFTINTFGYGYSLDSKLLVEISECGSGSYGYIPDSSMVGTIFVNYLSNVLSTCLSNSKINFTCDDPNVKLIGNGNIGSIIYDQPRELIYQINGLTKSTNIKIDIIVSDTIISTKNIQIIPDIFDLDSSCIPTINRYKIINFLNQKINEVENNSNLITISNSIKTLYDEIALINGTVLNEYECNMLKAYMQDYTSTDPNIGGQIEKAFSKMEWFNKWGKHFMRSIMNAYYYQQCNNFKDPGVQLFAGNLFNKIRNIADNIFCNLPAPTPSIKNYSNSYGGNINYHSAPTNMTAYYNIGGACFDGNSYVTMYSDNVGEYLLQVKFLKKGQNVKTLIDNQISTTKIICIIKSAVNTKKIKMCKVSNMLITPWHPIIYGDQWVFPINIAEEVEIELDCIYNIVLETGHVLFINNCPVVTLGHNFTEPIVSHPYYGSQEIIKDLSQFNGWDDGLILLDKPMIMRNNGLVTKLINK